jgi:glycerophosphoryl diester phosphodiesterase
MLLRAAAVAAVAFLALPAAAFDLQGHRGARGLMPENTLPAFAAALSTGVTTLEFDAAITKDGAVVIAHDRALNADIARGADGAYVTAPGATIRSLTLAEIKGYDVGALRPGSNYARQFATQKPVPGARIPTLAEVVALVRKSGNTAVRFNVETKLSPLAAGETLDPEAFAAAVVAALRAEGIAGRSTIQSFDWRTLKTVQRIAPEIPTVCLTLARGANDNVQVGRPDASPWLAGLDIDDFGGSIPKLVKAAGCAVWSPFFRDLTGDALTEAKTLGIPVVVWTINEPADMARLIDMGVDGIITDYPDRLRDVAAEKSIALPAPTPVEP